MLKLSDTNVNGQQTKGHELSNSIDRYELREAPGHLIRRAQQRAVDLYVEEVGDGGLTPRQFALLLTVTQNPGLIQTDLVNLTGIDRSTVTDMVRRMVQRGYVERRRARYDQRCIALWITGAGRHAVQENFARTVRAQERILEPLPPELRETFLRCLKIVSEMPSAAGAPTPREPKRSGNRNTGDKTRARADGPGEADTRTTEPALDAP